MPGVVGLEQVAAGMVQDCAITLVITLNRAVAERKSFMMDESVER